MRRIAIGIALLAGCHAPASRQAEPGKKVAANLPGPPVDGRFFARGPSGEERRLELHKLAVDVTTHPGTVTSHLSMEVNAPGEGQLEAVMRLPVPRGAAVTDAVLWVDGKPMRGAFVERQRASAIYTSIVTRRRDPALVTWDGPGWIAVSIFPLVRNEPRRFELEWVEPAAIADGKIQYRVPIVADAARIVGRAAIKVDGRRLPTGDAQDLVAIAPADRHKAFTRRAPGDPFQQVMVPMAAAVGAPHFVLVAETSAGMTRADRHRQRAALDAIFEELSPEARVTVLAADWDVTSVLDDAGSRDWPAALAKIDAVPSAGPLHLERALHEAAARARKTGAAAVLFVGRGEDGFDGDAIAGPLAELREAHVSLSAVGVGPSDLPRPLAAATVETGGEAVAARAVDEALPYLVDALRPRPNRPELDARGDGEWHVLRTVVGSAVWIGRVLDTQPADEAETARADAGSPLALDLAALWDRARLEWQDRDPGDEVAKVVTPVTSLLVLESDADYRRFGLEVPEAVEVARGTRDRGEAGRTGLAGEQVRNAGILGVLKQQDAPPSPATGNDSTNVLGGLVGNQIGSSYSVGGLGLTGTGTGEGTIGLGNLGTIGKGASDGGNGSGYGRGVGGLGGKRARMPEVIPGVANVRGALDKEIVRRIIRRHINEVKYCYEQELARRPGLGGRVMVQFTIGASGAVIASVLQNSTLGNAHVENCTVQAVRRWEFPQPLGGGIVIVSYPFVMTPSGAEGEERSAGPAPEPRGPIADALALLTKGTDPARIVRIAALLGMRRVSSAEALAWTIDRRSASLELRLLVVRLLELTKHRHDAVRVLTESARMTPDAVAAELRAMSAGADAAEVLRLAKR